MDLAAPNEPQGGSEQDTVSSLPAYSWRSLATEHLMLRRVNWMPPLLTVAIVGMLLLVI